MYSDTDAKNNAATIAQLTKGIRGR